MTYLVTLRWNYGAQSLTRRIAENGITSADAKAKVWARYNSPEMVSKIGWPEYVKTESSMAVAY